MRLRSLRLPASCALALCVACHGDSPTQVDGAIQPGQSLSVSGARSFTLDPGASAAEYAAVVVNTSITSSGAESFSFSGDGITTPLASLAPTETGSLSRALDDGRGAARTIDRAWEARVRARERADLTPRIAAARAWYTARTAAPAPSPSSSASLSPTARRSSAIPSTVKVGDTVTLNVNLDVSCLSPIYRKARVAAISARAIVLSDSANPSGGFTDADFLRFATRFDTLIYPLDTAAFGNPTDIDGNGRVALIFTVEINKQTAPNASEFTSGITFSRDLFPKVATTRLEACAGSNEAEAFYLMAPDPLGTINGNRRSKGFVDSNTTPVIAHEFQHLINQSRRLYVNNASVFEATWLDEGLAHVAEELLFFHDSGLSPRSNLATPDIQATSRRLGAFNQDMNGNLGRYRQYLAAPSTSSPYSKVDALSTRGAAYDFLRYLADRAGPTDGDVFYRLANATDSGTTNLARTFGVDVPSAVRDWSVSQVVDDVAPVDAVFLQPSWNWRSIYGTYPLLVRRMATGTTYNGSVIPGGAAFFTLGVPAGTKATVTLGGQPAGSTNLQLVVVRTR